MFNFIWIRYFRNRKKKNGQYCTQGVAGWTRCERKWLTLHGMIVVPSCAEYFNKIPGANVRAAIHGRTSSCTMTHLIRPRSAFAVPPIPVAFHRLPYIMWFIVPVHPIKLGRETRLKYIKGQRVDNFSRRMVWQLQSVAVYFSTFRKDDILMKHLTTRQNLINQIC